MKDFFARTMGKKCIGLFCIVMAAVLSCQNFKTLKVSYCYPSNHAVGIATNSAVEIGFSNSVDRSSAENGFSLSSSNGAIDGGFVWDGGSSFSFVPRRPLASGVRYLITISRLVEDTDRNSMEEDFLSEFYVGNDFEGPSIVSSNPQFSNVEITGVNVRQNIQVVFSEPMDQLSAQTAFAVSPSVSGYYLWEQNDTVMTYVLTAGMSYGSHYRFTVDNTAKDKAGNALKNPSTGYFQTGDDFVIPEVTGVYRAGDVTRSYYSVTATNSVNKDIAFVVVFNKAMKRKQTESAVRIAPSVSGVFTWNATDTEMTFTPDDPLLLETEYIVQIDKGAADTNGKNPENNYQVLLKTDGAVSRYIAFATVSYSNSDLVSFTSPTDIATMSYPYYINTGPASATPLESERDIYLKFTFRDSLGTGVSVDPKSVLRTEVYPACFGETYNAIYINNITFFNNNSEVVYELKALAPYLSGVKPVLYRLTFPGGKDGITDDKGNFMKNDFIIDFIGETPAP